MANSKMLRKSAIRHAQPQGEERAFQRFKHSSSLSAPVISFVWDNLDGLAGTDAKSNDTLLSGTRAAPTMAPSTDIEQSATTASVIAALATLRMELAR
jgi:hypothetical protein